MILLCKECGSAFTRKPGPGRNPHYCSLDCRARVRDRQRLSREERSQIASAAARAQWAGHPREPKLLTGHRAGDHTQCELDYRHGTCSECGKTVAVSQSSAPPELRRCRDCQRATPKRHVSLWKPLIMTCPCGAVFEQHRHRQLYCRPEHRPNPPRKALARTAARGYGATHQRARREALAAFVPGTPCVRCGWPMEADDVLHLDHADENKAEYLGLAHARCNLSWGAKKGNGLRRAS